MVVRSASCMEGMIYINGKMKLYIIPSTEMNMCMIKQNLNYQRLSAAKE